ncbi:MULTISPECIES: hypothetical protein [Metallosphaera]|uniref:hypothetical protein n=1 Tax=Metallosphaera TaxID=41980 RepID=UPI001F0692E3|nr:hypothetical protein [Metallosphaera sedula]MCH1771264.1 hypothetical protein [Metallosphaera sedula]MCP6729654.1 hypothetical protein [Metallosphaera sedula]
MNYASRKDEVPRREIENIKEVKGKRKVITWDYEDEIDGISFVPLWRFLLK